MRQDHTLSALQALALGFGHYFSKNVKRKASAYRFNRTDPHSSDRQFARYVSQGLHNTPDGRIERKKGRNNTYSSGE